MEAVTKTNGPNYLDFLILIRASNPARDRGIRSVHASSLNTRDCEM